MANLDEIKLIEKLLFSKPSNIITVSSSDPSNERVNQFAILNELEKEMLGDIMFKILEYGFKSEELNRLPEDPLYYMATHFEVTDDDIHFRMYSDCWSLLIYDDDKGNKIFDFNGWPGDNEHGFIWFIEHDREPIILFENNDSGLSVHFDDYYGELLDEIMNSYQERRFSHLYNN
jgi:hypothetical protein